LRPIATPAHASHVERSLRFVAPDANSAVVGGHSRAADVNIEAVCARDVARGQITDGNVCGAAGNRKEPPTSALLMNVVNDYTH
jgi:hypothetical protein